MSTKWHSGFSCLAPETLVGFFSPLPRVWLSPGHCKDILGSQVPHQLSGTDEGC